MKNLGKIIIFFIILVLFSFISLLFREQVIFLDELLFNYVNGFYSPVIDIVLIPLTYFGSIFFWLFLTIILWVKNDKKLSVYLIYAIILDTLLSLSLKLTFLRERPYSFMKRNIFLEEDLGPSFPSGHSEKAFSGAVILSSQYGKLKIVFYIFAILTAISRIYIGIHYPLDVIFGSLIGLIVGNIILNLPTKETQQKIEKSIRKLKILFKL